MPIPSAKIIQLLNTFAPAFTKPTFNNALILLYGTILAVGARTVTAALRAVGLTHHPNFTTYHRVLNRARWSPLVLSRLLLGLLLVRTLIPADAPLVLLVDETLERRRGKKIAYKSYFRDVVRSTSQHPLKSEGIRWLCVALLVQVPWNESRQWALPFLTVPALAPATSEKLGKPHRTVIDKTQLLVRLVRRWQPEREVVLVGDGNYAAVRLGHTLRELSGEGRPMARLVARLRLDATLHSPPGPQPEGKRGPKPKKGRREPNLKARLEDPESEWHTVSVAWYGGEEKTLEMMTGTSLWYREGEDPLPIRWVLLRCPDEHQHHQHQHQPFPPMALFCTDPESSVRQIVGWFVGRWSIEVAFEEARAHLGMETQRQWSMRALGRSTPCLLGLFSVVVVLAKALHPEELLVRRAAWYSKEEASFIDALAAVRGELWWRGEENYEESSGSPDLVLIPRPLWDSVRETLCYAA